MRIAGLEHLEELHHLGNDLDEWAEIRVNKTCIPKGAKLVEAYLTEREVIVMGQPREDDHEHNCDAMGCGFSHVLYRFNLPGGAKNDPKGLNRHWLRNVKANLNKR